MSELKENNLYPVHVFRFQVDFREQFIGSKAEGEKVVSSIRRHLKSYFASTYLPQQLYKPSNQTGKYRNLV